MTLNNDELSRVWRIRGVVVPRRHATSIERRLPIRCHWATEALTIFDKMQESQLGGNEDDNCSSDGKQKWYYLCHKADLTAPQLSDPSQLIFPLREIQSSQPKNRIDVVG
jgi:hypothetical protein